MTTCTLAPYKTATATLLNVISNCKYWHLKQQNTKRHPKSHTYYCNGTVWLKILVSCFTNRNLTALCYCLNYSKCQTALLQGALVCKCCYLVSVSGSEDKKFQLRWVILLCLHWSHQQLSAKQQKMSTRSVSTASSLLPVLLQALLILCLLLELLWIDNVWAASPDK